MSTQPVGGAPLRVLPANRPVLARPARFGAAENHNTSDIPESQDTFTSTQPPLLQNNAETRDTLAQALQKLTPGDEATLHVRVAHPQAGQPPVLIMARFIRLGDSILVQNRNKTTDVLVKGQVAMPHMWLGARAGDTIVLGPLGFEVLPDLEKPGPYGGLTRPDKPAAIQSWKFQEKEDTIEAGVSLLDGFRYCPHRRYMMGRDGMPTDAQSAHNPPDRILLIDRKADPVLNSMVEWAESLRRVSQFQRFMQIGRVVSMFFPSRPAGENEARVDAQPKRRLYLGEAVAHGAGVCPERSLLFKVLADAAGLQARLRRGLMQTPTMISPASHLWNDLAITDGSAPSGQDKLIFDLAQPGGMVVVGTPSSQDYYLGVGNGDSVYPQTSPQDPTPKEPQPIPAKPQP